MSEIAEQLGVTRNVIAGIGNRYEITFRIDPIRHSEKMRQNILKRYYG